MKFRHFQEESDSVEPIAVPCIRHQFIRADYMALSSFGCPVSGEPHLFKICVLIEQRATQGNCVLSRIVFRRLEDGEELLNFLDSITLLPR
jgi:hypothetical protein